MSMTINPRSIGIEGHYLTTDVRELAALKRKLEDAGVPASQAAGIIGWIVDKSADGRDLTNSQTRARYRKTLAELGEHDGPPARVGIGTFTLALAALALATMLREGGSPQVLVMSSEQRAELADLLESFAAELLAADDEDDEWARRLSELVGVLPLAAA